jgi:hypothetical protein
LQDICGALLFKKEITGPQKHAMQFESNQNHKEIKTSHVSGRKSQGSRLKMPTTNGYFVLFIMCDL